MAYCTHIDLIRYGNTTRLLSQLAGRDYGAIPTPEEVEAYFLTGDSTPDNLPNLQSIKSRVEQAIANSSGEINGYMALCRSVQAGFAMPSETLATVNMDLALARLFDTLADDSVIKLNADRWIAMFDKIATGKVAPPSSVDDHAMTGSADTVSTDMVWTQEAFDGY